VEISNDGHHFSSNGRMVNIVQHLSLDRVEPNRTRTTGDTLVTVWGRGVSRSPYTKCQLSGQTVSGTVLDNMKMLCHAPVHTAGKVQLEVSNDGVAFSNSTVPVFVEFYAPTEVHAVLPVSGPDSGQTLLTVTGMHFSRDHHGCTIGQAHQSARQSMWKSSTLILCNTPEAAMAGGMIVEVGINEDGVLQEEHAVNGTVRFTYYTEISLTSVMPSFGVAHGGQVITIIGKGFVQSSTLRCRFGPENENVGTALSSTILECRVPAGRPGNVSIAVANNGIDFEGDGLLFEYQLQGKPATLIPSNGPIRGGTGVTVLGGDFPSGKLFCMFGLDSTAAQVLNRTAVLCISPAVHSAAVVQLRIEFSQAANDDFAMAARRLRQDKTKRRFRMASWSGEAPL
jgi:hypothetical protein